MRLPEPFLALALGHRRRRAGCLPSPPRLAGYPAACDATKVSKGDVERAHTVFLSGKGFLDESNYDKAISYFKDAYSIDCSVHAILPIIATAYERKGDKASAVTALQEYLKRVPTAPDREVSSAASTTCRTRWGRPSSPRHPRPPLRPRPRRALPRRRVRPVPTTTATATAAPDGRARLRPRRAAQRGALDRGRGRRRRCRQRASCSTPSARRRHDGLERVPAPA